MRKAFTFSEIVVAVAIVVVLAGGAALYYPGMTGKAKESALRSNLTTVRKVIDDFYADFGRYPATLSELVEPGPGGYFYLREIPDDPVCGGPVWEISEDGIVWFRSDSSTGPAFVARIRSTVEKYKDI